MLLVLACNIEVCAQTITITNVDPGPYTPGSTIAATLHIDNTSGCIATNNVFKLYLSDASGSFDAKTLIGSSDGFYATFVNGVLPANLPAGTGYQLRIESTQPAIVSSPSAAFSIVDGASLTAVLNGPPISDSHPDVFGLCLGVDKAMFSFTSGTTASGVKIPVIASFYNEYSSKNDDIQTVGENAYEFTAQATNYTIFVKTTTNGTVATKAYQLLNNSVYTSIGSSGNNSVCLANGAGNIVFTGDINNLPYNYPGNVYFVTFGDGSSATLTACELLNSKGRFSHTYSTSSCGFGNDQKNAFPVVMQTKNPYCGEVGSPANTSVKVFEAPYNKIKANASACTNNEVVFTNDSYPGQNPLNTDGTCLNNSAKYTWYVDGVPVTKDASVYDKFKYTFTTTGKHIVKLTLQGGVTACDQANVSDTICVQNAPQPAFELDKRICFSSSATAVDKSVVDNTCTIGDYLWTVTGPAAVNYAGGTSSSSKQPQFIFSIPGVYQVVLSISSASCGPISSDPAIIIVDGPPISKLSADVAICGNNQTLTFGPGAGPTQSVLTGTGQTAADTYNWTITGGNYSFANGTDANSQYPQITFSDYAAYTITVNQQNTCGTAETVTQHLTFQQAPTVTAGTDQHICYNDQASLQGTITGTVNNYQWTGGNGTFANGRNTLKTNYIPSDDEIAAGQVTLYLQASTNLAAPCNRISTPVTIFITPAVTVTSKNTLQVCTGQQMNYAISGSVPSSTFTWKAVLSSGSASGFTAQGNGNTINDNISVTGNSNAVITYTIVPSSATSSCPGKPFTLKVTVTPLPNVKASTANNTICSGQNTSINLSSNISGTTYTWTSTVSGKITGNSNQATSLSGTNITDVLVNSGTTIGSVTYTVTPHNSGACAGSPTNITITINPVTPDANAGSDQTICNASTATLGDASMAVSGTWTQTGGPAVYIANPSSYKTQVTGLSGSNVYNFTWTIAGLSPCANTSDEVMITDLPDVTPAFSSSVQKGCGPLRVTFTNTSVNSTNASFVWDFGDGTPTSSEVNPTHTFAPSINGKDATYNVTLRVLNNCALHDPAANLIEVSPATPVASLLASNLTGCAPFIVSAENTSPGTNKSYDFYLYDGAKLVQKITKTDKSAINFDAITPTVTKAYTLYMVATNNCGITAESTHIPITVSPPDLTPQFIVESNKTKGCLPLKVNLINNSAGGTQFYYKIYDAANNQIDRLIAGAVSFSYQFEKPGDYAITITAADDCSPTGIESPKTYFHVYAIPTPSFKADVVSDCKMLTVNFSNNTPAAGADAPATSLNYLWDFGDNSQSSDFAPVHTYTRPGNYSVTLTATNTATGCSSTSMLASYITITSPPDANFSVEPDTVTSIPNYHFSFTDETTGTKPSTWHWNFGDNTESSSRNTSHTYADTGHYTVTLLVADGTGCTATKVRHVVITGVPGQLFVPNAFMPGSATEELRTFKAKGSGIQAYHLQIFNNWGQLVWETSVLNNKGEPIESWDGTFKGTPVPQGVYIWQMTARFINGTEWKGMSYGSSTPSRTGAIHLLR